MNRKIYLFFILVLLLGVNKTNAQTAPAMRGQFAVPVAGSDSILVHYGLSPTTQITDVLNVFLYTTNQMFFSVDVLNAADNSVLIHWAPDSTSNTYNHPFDVSTFATGNYSVNINDNSNTILQSIPFTK